MMKKEYLLKNSIIAFIFIIATQNSFAVICRVPPYLLCAPGGDCDKVIDCAMETQRDAIEARLDDLINAIKANTKQTKHQTKIIEQEVLSYRRLLKRVQKESLSLKKASYLSKKIKDSEALGVNINIIGKGK